jgi:recombination protein RecT
MTGTSLSAVTFPQQVTKSSFRVEAEKWGPQLAAVAANGMTPDRIISAALHIAVENPALFDCTPASLFLSMTKAARLGLDVGEGIHFVPLKVKVKDKNGERYVQVCEAWPDYKGLKALAIRQGLVREMHEYCVYEHEELEREEGLEPRFLHRPLPPSKRGRLIGAYTRIRLPRGGTSLHFMYLEEIEKIRAGSRSWGPGKHRECPEWYAMKTVVRNYLNKQPKAGALAEALELDDVDGVIEPAALPAGAQQIGVGRPTEPEESSGEVDEAEPVVS